MLMLCSSYVHLMFAGTDLQEFTIGFSPHLIYLQIDFQRIEKGTGILI